MSNALHVAGKAASIGHANLEQPSREPPEARPRGGFLIAVLSDEAARGRARSLFDQVLQTPWSAGLTRRIARAIDGRRLGRPFLGVTFVQVIASDHGLRTAGQDAVEGARGAGWRGSELEQGRIHKPEQAGGLLGVGTTMRLAAPPPHI